MEVKLSQNSRQMTLVRQIAIIPLSVFGTTGCYHSQLQCIPITLQTEQENQIREFHAKSLNDFGFMCQLLYCRFRLNGSISPDQLLIIARVVFNEFPESQFFIDFCSIFAGKTRILNRNKKMLYTGQMNYLFSFF